jgi:hypothetical protein
MQGWRHRFKTVGGGCPRPQRKRYPVQYEITSICADFLVELGGFEPMAIAGAARSRGGSPLGDSLARSRPPSAEDFPFAWPPLDFGEEERTFVVISA